MTDRDIIEQAAEIILNNGARAIRDGAVYCSGQDDDALLIESLDIAEALADAGLLAGPDIAVIAAHDAERCRALAERDAAFAKLDKVRELVAELPMRTHGPDKAGIARWPADAQDVYSLAIEEAQAVLRAALDGEDS